MIKIFIKWKKTTAKLLAGTTAISKSSMSKLTKNIQKSLNPLLLTKIVFKGNSNPPVLFPSSRINPISSTKHRQKPFRKNNTLNQTSCIKS